MFTARKIQSTLFAKACFASLMFAALVAAGQGTFIYDQQSSTEGNYGEGGAYIQQSQPIGQSFTPTNSFVGFIRLFVANGYLGNTSTASLYVNLLANSITGPVLGQSALVTIPGGPFSSTVDFFFANPVPVTPGVTYYFQPIQPAVQNNNYLSVNASLYGYSGGTAFFNGAASSIEDLWFREGNYVVPEPSALSLVIGGGVWFYVRRNRNKMRSPG